MERDRRVFQPGEPEAVFEQASKPTVGYQLRRLPRNPASPVSGRVGNTSACESDRHRSASAVIPARSGGDAIQPPLTAPTDVPTISSGAMPASARPRSMPTWIEPRLAPPESTNAAVIALIQPTAAATHLATVGAGTARRPLPQLHHR